jgi:phosphoglycolate phosphatase
MSGAASIGFDLDMTLVDSRPVSRRALERLVSEYGAQLDVSALMLGYGLPLSRWLPADVDGPLFRRLQSQDIGLAKPMLGARAAIDAVRRTADRVVVVTSAPFPIADGMLRASGLRVDCLRTGVWGGDKAEPLREERCWAFVGDHADDMLAARRAGVVGIGVTTGTSHPAGADVELKDLTEFPGWLATRSPWTD